MTELIVPTRRRFLTGLIAAVAAPAIVRPGLLMPVKVMLPSSPVPMLTLDDFMQRIMQPYMDALHEVITMSIMEGTGTVWTDLMRITVEGAGTPNPVLELYPRNRRTIAIRYECRTRRTAFYYLSSYVAANTELEQLS